MKPKREKTEFVVQIDSVIRVIRGEKVILASDLAKIYGVETRTLNQAVKRNKEKFPGDFMFQLTRREAEDFRRSRSHSVTLKRGANYRSWRVSSQSGLIPMNKQWCMFSVNCASSWSHLHCPNLNARASGFNGTRADNSYIRRSPSSRSAPCSTTYSVCGSLNGQSIEVGNGKHQAV